MAGRARREGRRPQGPPLPALRRRTLRRRAAEDRAGDRGARPHQGAGLGRRAALPGRRHGAVRGGRRGPAAEGRRRPVRAFLEGVHARDDRRRLRESRPTGAPQPLHRRHRRRRDAHLAALGRRARHRARRRGARGLLRPRLRRHRRGEQELGEDPRRGDRRLRPGLLRLRLEEVGRGHGLAPAPLAPPDPLGVPRAPGRLRRLPPVRAPEPAGHPRPRARGRDRPAERAVRPRPSSGTACRARSRSRRSPAGCGSSPSTPYRDRARGRPEGPDQHDHADLPLRARRGPAARGRDREDQEGDPGHLRQARPRDPEAQLRRGRPRARRPLRGGGARDGDLPARAARRPSPRPRRSSCSA